MNKIEENLVKLIRGAIKEAYSLDLEEGMINIEIPRDSNNGDYSSNIAMRLAKELKNKPTDIALKLKDYLNIKGRNCWTWFY